jgi:lysyl endopeptidase
MKKLYVLMTFIGLSLFGMAQKLPNPITKQIWSKDIPTVVVPMPNMAQIQLEDQERDRQGILYRIGVAHFVNIRTENSGVWTQHADGSREWNLRVSTQGAEAMSFLFETFKVFGGTTLSVKDENGNLLHKPFTTADVEEHLRQHIPLCFGNDMYLSLVEPANTLPSEIYIDRIMYNYRSTGNPNVPKINESDPCQVNVNCSPVGDIWQDEKRGVARILVVEGNSQGWCSGSLINNTAQNCKPYFLTALHCGVSSTTANMNQWKFYFRYEAPTCTNPTSVGTLANNVITGCVKISDSGDGGGDSGSDFLLVRLGSATNESTIISTLKSANFNAYWNGWDANNTTTNSGASIHHPAGDIKKISTFTANMTTTGWNGNGVQSHWRVVWTSNQNGHGVTEGGSSGSPIFRNNGGNSLIMGTLTGGASFCNALSQPDYYGKMSYHWTQNGTADNRRLRPWLDPTNSGVLVLNGSNDPCSNPVPPVAQFTANQTNIPTGTTVNFTDQSTGNPTTWAWSISPTSGWSYAGGTSASSQNPQVTFTTVGQYSVTLNVSNAQGADGEIKNNYITVTQPTDPCAAASTTCDEFIQNVNLNTINNTSACTNYTNYNATTTLLKGTQYTLTVTPQITGSQPGSAYTGNEIAAWIDFNNNLSFTDAGERVGFVSVATGWSNEFQFTVPANAVTGNVRMRVRIGYNGAQGGEGTVSPCGTTQYGEVEDYTINIQPAGTSDLSELSLENVQVFPNPTNDLLTVDWSSTQVSFANIQVMDLTGKVLLNMEALSSKIELNLGQFATGTYLIKLHSDKGTIIKTIVKN